MVWLIGCNGMLGTELSRQLKENNIDFIGTDRNVDITNIDILKDFVKQNNNIEWIINCSAYTAVDNAEDDKEKANLLNNIGVKNIAIIAKSINAKLIHISTDYVFDGSANIPYTEDMNVCPIGVYGNTKALGENAIQETLTDYYIFRTAWLYGFDGKNFVYTMIKLMNSKEKISVVGDQKGSPTFTGDLAFAIIKVITSKELIPYGIYHFTNMGEITWYDFACEIYKKAKEYNKIQNECNVTSCSTSEYPTKAKRPAYSVLSKDKIQKALNYKLPDWKESLEKFITSPLFHII